MARAMNLHPWDTVLAAVEEHIKHGVDCFQQFNCEHCGQKLTMETPNAFHESGTCDKCGKLTNIKKNGCNYMVQSRTPEGSEYLLTRMAGGKR